MNVKQWISLFMSKKTGAMKIIDYAHHEIHGGRGFEISQRTAVNDFDVASPINFQVTTPNTTRWLHMQIYGECNTPAYWELYEDTGVLAQYNTSGGTIVTPVARNRNSSNVSGAVVRENVTVVAATADALLATEAIARAGGTDRHEFVLKPNTRYLIRATSYTDNNEGSLVLDWYEHIDKSY